MRDGVREEGCTSRRSPPGSETASRAAPAASNSHAASQFAAPPPRASSQQSLATFTSPSSRVLTSPTPAAPPAPLLHSGGCLGLLFQYRRGGGTFLFTGSSFPSVPRRSWIGRLLL
ncbi:uncharacterized protein LOC133911912 isoform X2 [Phragmites australis]|uniref:uncharacterized protein LOC133911912 isoform X2 n=1 Tax=Phragmites australis TaxID=29695 RepID=UPI002D768511|nr:uncharacterized protein LOC133911912 isoform X2 [Phragmites australis]